MAAILHYFLHLLFPGWMAYWLAPKNWLRTYGLLLATMLVDLDHLLANPVFQADRCSIGFHPLHTAPAMFAYGSMLLYKGPWRILGLGLLFHMLTDWIDCQLM